MGLFIYLFLKNIINLFIKKIIIMGYSYSIQCYEMMIPKRNIVVFQKCFSSNIRGQGRQRWTISVNTYHHSVAVSQDGTITGTSGKQVDVPGVKQIRQLLDRKYISDKRGFRSCEEIDVTSSGRQSLISDTQTSCMIYVRTRGSICQEGEIPNEVFVREDKITGICG